MRLSLALSVVPLAISAGAITLTEPKKGANIIPSSSVDVKWTSVDTDASSFDIYLVNNAVYPPVNKKLASDVETSKDSYTVDIGDIPNGHGYQINLMSDEEHNKGILAQTGQFNVTGSAQSSSSASTASSTSNTKTSSSTTVSTTATPFTTEVVSTSTGVSTTVEITHAVTSTPSAGMVTSASSAAASGSASATPSTGAGAAVLAHPAAVGVIGGALAFML